MKSKTKTTGLVCLALLLPAAFAPSVLLAADPPRVAQVRVHCETNALIITFTKPVNLLDGDYTLDHSAMVLGRSYGASTAEVVLATTPLTPLTAYTLSVTGVHDLEMPANLQAPTADLWIAGCGSCLRTLFGSRGPGGVGIFEWGNTNDVLEVSTNLVSWSDVQGAASPYLVTPPVSAPHFFRLRCEQGGGGGQLAAILRHPESCLVDAGDTATFRAETVGAARLRYQWLFNGTNLAGATNESLTIANASRAQAGEYQLRVANEFATVVSQPAFLVINNGTDGLPFNTTIANPRVEILLLSSANTGGLPFNTTVASPPVEALLLSSVNTGGLPFNTTIANPLVEILLLSSANTGGLPFNTTIASPPVEALLLSSANTGGLPFNTTIANPLVEILLLSSTNTGGLPFNTTVAQPPVRVEWSTP